MNKEKLQIQIINIINSADIDSYEAEMEVADKIIDLFDLDTLIQSVKKEQKEKVWKDIVQAIEKGKLELTLNIKE